MGTETIRLNDEDSPGGNGPETITDLPLPRGAIDVDAFLTMAGGAIPWTVLSGRPFLEHERRHRSCSGPGLMC